MLQEILRQYSIAPVEWQSLITLMQVFHGKDQQVGQKDFFLMCSLERKGLKGCSQAMG